MEHNGKFQLINSSKYCRVSCLQLSIAQFPDNVTTTVEMCISELNILIIIIIVEIQMTSPIRLPHLKVFYIRIRRLL